MSSPRMSPFKSWNVSPSQQRVVENYNLLQTIVTDLSHDCDRPVCSRGTSRRFGGDMIDLVSTTIWTNLTVRLQLTLIYCSTFSHLIRSLCCQGQPPLSHHRPLVSCFYSTKVKPATKARCLAFLSTCTTLCPWWTCQRITSRRWHRWVIARTPVSFLRWPRGIWWKRIITWYS